jgi:hypothetical protein
MLTNSNTNLKQSINLNSFTTGIGGVSTGGANDIQIIDNNKSDRESNTSGGAKNSKSLKNKNKDIM